MFRRGHYFTRTFFINTEIIVLYESRTRQDIVKFIEHPDNKFYYTETVKSEFERTPKFSCFHDEYFTFVDSGINNVTKNDALKFLQESWLKEFESVYNKRELNLDLTDSQMINFSNELFIIMETSRCCYNVRDTQATLVTNNLKFYDKFIRKRKAIALLEKCVSFIDSGDLVHINFLDNVLE